jgi:hypothetical protein
MARLLTVPRGMPNAWAIAVCSTPWVYNSMKRASSAGVIDATLRAREAIGMAIAEEYACPHRAP